jgi:deoxyribonuclease-4
LKFGAHLSIAKGLPALQQQVEEYGMTAVQMFARNPRGRGETQVPEAEAKSFREATTKRGWPVVIHAPYYVNVGSGSKNNQRIAREVTKLDLEKGDYIGASYVVVHMGSPGDNCTINECTEHAIRTVGEVLETTDAKTMLLLETSAGPKKVASRFEQMRLILDGIKQPKRVGVCLDTCHVYVSGYDISSAKGMKNMLDEFGKVVGFEHLKLIHANDTQSRLGSGWDKHWHIGQGNVGKEAFKTLLQDKRIQDLPVILETPKENPETGEKDADTMNLAALKRLAR